MPTVDEFQTTIYVAGSYNGSDDHRPILRDAAGVDYQTRLDKADPWPLPDGEHFSISFPAKGGKPLVATTPAVSAGAPVADAGTGGLSVPFQEPEADDNAIYLPFKENMICSAILRADPASNIDAFYTDNLSGCSIFIDRLDDTGDLIVYHANRMNLTKVDDPAEYLEETPLMDQFTEARDAMRDHHNKAQRELSRAMKVRIEHVASLERAEYFACVEDEMNRKRADKRQNVDIGAAGTNVMGFRTPDGDWEFWWQTWADLTYDRPAIAPKGWFGNRQKQHQPGNARLLDARRFYPQDE